MKQDAQDAVDWLYSLQQLGVKLGLENISALLDYLGQNLSGVGLILRLSLIPDDSHFLGVLKKELAGRSGELAFAQRVKTLAPYITLPSSWEEYFGSVGRRRRKVLRRAWRGLEKEHGAVTFQRGDADSLEAGLDRFFDMHQQRWQAVGISGSFADPQVREFYREVAWKLLDRGWLYFSSMNAGGKLVSALYGCLFNQALYFIASGRDTGYAGYSVGNLHDMAMIKDAVSRNLKEFDFLQGDEPYKFYWTKSARRYMQITVIKRGFWPGLRLKLLRLFLRLWDVKQYHPREIWAILSIRRKERKELKEMGLLAELARMMKS